MWAGCTKLSDIDTKKVLRRYRQGGESRYIFRESDGSSVRTEGLLPRKRVLSFTESSGTSRPLASMVIRRTFKVASVEERVIDIVAEQLGVSKDQITRETSFVNDLGADSLDTVELVMELEEEFDINIPDDAAEKIQTVGQAIDHIEKGRRKQRNLLCLTDFHETTRCRHRTRRGHLAQLQGRRTLDSHLHGESGVRPLKRFDCSALPRHASAARSATGRPRATSTPRKPSGSTASPSSPWSPASTPCATPGSTSPRKTPTAAA